MTTAGMVSPPRAPDEARDRRVITAIAAVMAFEAATLAVVSALHLSGHVTGRASPFDANHAGIAEAIIGAFLAVGAAAMVLLPRRARAIGAVVNGLAIAGFVVGLTMTVRGGHRPDIAYHLVVLPALILSVVAVLHTRAAVVPNDGVPRR